MSDSSYMKRIDEENPAKGQAGTALTTTVDGKGGHVYAFKFIMPEGKGDVFSAELTFNTNGNPLLYATRERAQERGRWVTLHRDAIPAEALEALKKALEVEIGRAHTRVSPRLSGADNADVQATMRLGLQMLGDGLQRGNYTTAPDAASFTAACQMREQVNMRQIYVNAAKPKK